MKILLRTLDDCTRIMEIREFRPDVYTALMRPLKVCIDDECNVPFTSKFDRRRYVYSGELRNGMLVYVEDE